MLVAGLALCAAIVGARILADRPNGAVLRTVTVGRNPSAVAVAAEDDRVFVTNFTDGSVSMLDATSGRLLRTVAVARLPGAVAVVARLHRVLVLPAPLERAPRTLTVLDARTGAVLGAIHLAAPLGVAVDQRTGRAFIIAGDERLHLLDVVHLRLVRAVPVGPTPPCAYGPQAVAVDPRVGHVFVANTTTPSVSMFDARTGTRLRTVAVGVIPSAVAVDDRIGRVFVLNVGPISASGPAGKGTVSVIATMP